MSEISVAATAASSQRAEDRRRLILAAAIPLAAFGLQWLCWTVIEPFVWFLFFPAVFFSSWIGGRRGGLLATGLSAGLVWYFFIPPQLSFGFEQPSALFSSALFLVMGVLFSDFFERLKQANLRAVDARFRELFEQAAVGMTQIGLDGRLQRVNQRLSDILGHPREELLAKTLQDITHPDDLKTGAALMQQVLAGELPTYTLELRCLRQDRSTVPVSLTVSLVRDTAGKPEHFIAVIEDITKRKAAEAAVQDSERLLRTVIDLVPHFIFVKDKHSRHLLVNRACAEASGMTPAEMKGKCDLDFVGDRKQLEAFMRDDQEVIAGAKPKFVAAETFTDAAGRTRILQTTKIPFSGPDGQALLGVAVDITEHKKAMAAWQERENQLRLYAEYIPAAVAMFDRDMKCMVGSRRWITDHRLQDQSIIGRNLYEVFPEMPRHWIEIHRRCLAGGIEKCEEDALVRADGSTSYFRWEVRPWYLADGTIGGIIIFSEDITERRLAEQKLHASELRYRSLFELESDALFLGDGVTHQILEANQAAQRLYGYTRAEFLQLEHFLFR